MKKVCFIDIFSPHACASFFSSPMRRAGLVANAFLLLIFSTLLFGSCVIARGTVDDIRVGMTEAQVMHLLGAPHLRDVTPEWTHWHYEWATGFRDNEQRFDLSFHRGHVVDFHFYEQPVMRWDRQELNTHRRAERAEDDTFAALLTDVKAAVTDNSRLEMLEQASEDFYFSGRQVRELLRSFTFDSNRLKAFSLLAPRLHGHFSRESLLECFSFSSNRNEARAILDKLR